MHSAYTRGREREGERERERDSMFIFLFTLSQEKKRKRPLMHLSLVYALSLLHAFACHATSPRGVEGEGRKYDALWYTFTMNQVKMNRPCKYVSYTLQRVHASGREISLSYSKATIGEHNHSVLPLSFSFLFLKYGIYV